MMRGLFALALLAVTACASVGTDFDMAAVDRLKPGMTQTEVIRMLGRPTGRTRLADGTEHLLWSYGHGNAFGPTRSKAVMLKFGPDGRYVGTMSNTETVIR